MLHDYVCFLHLRWNFVYQRPQHLLSRFAKHHRVFIIEEPIFDAPSPYHQIETDPESGVIVVTPHLPHSFASAENLTAERTLLDMLFQTHGIQHYIFWYYSPMALACSSHLQPSLIVYDCMDELSAFKFAPPELKQNEARMFKKADIVFTGGHHLFEAKRDKHRNIFPVPSSIDKAHFAKARASSKDPIDQEGIPHPRLGFYGVIDERFDIDLLKEIALMRREWQFIIVGPIVKIDFSTLPRNENIHYLGPKDYKELPQYLGGWDIAMMPFALNESTRYISPTKTPEFLAAGKEVISTSIRDVVIPYAVDRLVHIADTPDEFVASADLILAKGHDSGWLEKVDNFLTTISWDDTWHFMKSKIQESLEHKKTMSNHLKPEPYV